MTPENLSFPERLKAWRTKARLTQEQARHALNIGRSYYNRLEKGKKTPGKYVLQKFEILEREPVHSVHDIVDQNQSRVQEERGVASGARTHSYIYEGRRNNVRRVPLLGWAQAGEAVDFDAVIDWDNFVSVEINDPKAIAVRIRGDSMAPRYVDGNIAVLACSDEAKSEDLVIARLSDGVVFKKLQIIDAEKQLYRFISFNEEYAPIERTAEQIIWIYPVDSVIQKLRR